MKLIFIGQQFENGGEIRKLSFFHGKRLNFTQL